MAERSEGMEPGGNVGQVFFDLHSRAQSFIGELDARREAEYGPDSLRAEVPGTELQLRDIKIWPTGGGYWITRSVLAGLEGGDSQKLFAATNFETELEDEPEPTRVEANRADELGGDYSICVGQEGQPKPGFIHIKLGNKGGYVDGEPVGETVVAPATALGELNTHNVQRLAVVRLGIANAIVAAEAILDGRPAEEALGAAGLYHALDGPAPQ